MTYSAGQVVEVCSEQSKAWVSFGYGSKITLERLIPPDEGYAGQWEAVTATGVRGILSEEEFRPIPEHSPIRTETVTVRRLEPGVYGPLRIWREISIPDCDRPDETPVREVEVSFAATNIDENGIELRSLNASEWRELARVALEIAEYLENA